jgi:hypothetical protein
MHKTVAALFVMPDGCYSELDFVDLWPESRDAMKYAGPLPVVAHPPCARWSRLAGLVEHVYGIKKGDDGGTFASALAAVRTFGGVLEHPAESAAWPQYNLPRPVHGAWIRTFCGGWVTQVAQSTYGHRAIKLTWLYYVGNAAPPALDWSIGPHTARVSELQNRGGRTVARMGRRERIATPVRFRDLLLQMAMGA